MAGGEQRSNQPVLFSFFAPIVGAFFMLLGLLSHVLNHFNTWDKIFGGVGGIRTLGRLLTVTRFPVVLVMTASIPLHEELPFRSLKQLIYYNMNSEIVKPFFEKSRFFYFCCFRERNRAGQQ